MHEELAHYNGVVFTMTDLNFQIFMFGTKRTAADL